MKAFEEWQKKRAIKTIGFSDTYSAYKFGEKEGWRAALEHVLKRLNEIYEGGFENSEIVKDIEKELEN